MIPPERSVYGKQKRGSLPIHCDGRVEKEPIPVVPTVSEHVLLLNETAVG